jgi:ectoine hydroxylase-related dioxygenase (phytanoyl-CoA dioxygenase family)
MASTVRASDQIDPAVVDRALAEIVETGFCVIRSVMPPERIDEIRTILEVILYQEAGLNRLKDGHQRVLHLAVKHPFFLEPLCHPLVLAVWRKYLGEDIICSTYTANCLWPGCTALYWHCDHPYWTIKPPYPSFRLTGETIWMLDDFTVENGATAGIPGSHRLQELPALEHRWTDDARILTGSKGDVIMADGAWWHTSTPNQTEGRRSALLATYIRAFCVTQEDMRRQLALIEAPSPIVTELLGGHQYQPQKGFPY